MNGPRHPVASVASRGDPAAALKRRFTRQNILAVAALFAVAALTPSLPFVEGWMLGQAALDAGDSGTDLN